MPETFWGRLWEKTKKDPLIPIGCTATFMALSMGLYAFKSGQKHLSQKMMRARVLAQGFTIAVLAVGSFYNLQISPPSQQLALVHQEQQPSFEDTSATTRRRQSSSSSDRRF